MTNQSVSVCCGCGLVWACSKPNKVTFFSPNDFFKWLIIPSCKRGCEQCRVQLFAIAIFKIIFTWIQRRRGGLLLCWRWLSAPAHAFGCKPIPLIVYAVACLHLKKATDTFLILIVYTLEVPVLWVIESSIAGAIGLLASGLFTYRLFNSLHIVNRNFGMAPSDIYGINSCMAPWGSIWPNPGRSCGGWAGREFHCGLMA